jgi:mannose-6-phosphate isomerase-like protein (cupin superfamily)
MSRKVAWITSITPMDKSWGVERMWSSPGHSHNKILKMNKGHKTKLKRYNSKNESFYLVSGKLAVIYGDEKSDDKSKLQIGILNEDEVLSVPSMCPYSLEAIEDSVVIETSDGFEQSYQILD